MTSRLVPDPLSDEKKRDWVRLCCENLTKFRSGSWRLCDTITDNETWIYNRQIGHKSTNAS